MLEHAFPATGKRMVNPLVPFFPTTEQDTLNSLVIVHLHQLPIAPALLPPSCPTQRGDQRLNPSAFSMNNWHWQDKAMNLFEIYPSVRDHSGVADEIDNPFFAFIWGEFRDGQRGKRCRSAGECCSDVVPRVLKELLPDLAEGKNIFDEALRTAFKSNSST